MNDLNRSAKPTQNLPEIMENQVLIWQAVAEAASHIAASKRTVFLAYVAEGFTEIQALELIKTL